MVFAVIGIAGVAVVCVVAVVFYALACRAGETEWAQIEAAWRASGGGDWTCDIPPITPEPAARSRGPRHAAPPKRLSGPARSRGA